MHSVATPAPDGEQDPILAAAVEPGPASPIDRRSQYGLDGLNFFVANLQQAFGPFIAVYLTSEHWTQGQIGLALTVGSVTGIASQVPAGAFVDAVSNKHAVAAAAIVTITLSCLLLAMLPERLPVTVAEVLHGIASCILNPAIAAITLSLVATSAALQDPQSRSRDAAEVAAAAHSALGERFGRNASFASIGSAVAAALMGGIGYTVSAGATFFVGALLSLPGLVALRAIRRPASAGPAAPQAGRQPGVAPRLQGLKGLSSMVHDRRLRGFAVCVVFYHLSNGFLLSLAAGQLTRESGRLAELVIAACMLLPQIMVAGLSPLVGRWAGRYGRRPIMLVAFSALPLQGLMLAVSTSPAMTIAAQCLGAINSAAFGVMLPLVAADLSRGTGRFNLLLGLLSLAMVIGASLSSTLGGLVADRSVPGAFLMLSGAGMLCVLSVLLLFRESAPDPVRPLGLRAWRRARAARAGSARAGTPD